MLRIVSFYLFVGTCLSLQATASHFTIKGKVTDVDSGFVFIRNLTKPVPDTVQIRKGQFMYTASIDEPTPHVITDEKNRYQLFFADPGDKIEITLKRNEMQVLSLLGSAAQDIFMKLLVKQDPWQRMREQLQQAMNVPNANRDSLQVLLFQISNQTNANFYQFLSENGQTEVAAFLVYSSISNERGLDARVADSMYTKLSGKALSSFYGKEAKKATDKLRAVTVGYIAPDFTLPDSSGTKKYTLSKLRGKYLLVDFWASWCGPCKGEIPYMKEAYKNFHDKGFEIMSVSLDDKRENWLNALRQFQMPWIQVSDCKGFRSTVNDLYPIPSIPKTILLDKEGKIIATDLRGTALDKKLEELFHQE